MYIIVRTETESGNTCVLDRVFNDHDIANTTANALNETFDDATYDVVAEEYRAIFENDITL